MATEEQARAAKRRNSYLLLRQPGISGLGVERDGAGNYFLAIHTDGTVPDIDSKVPAELDGCPTRIVRSGPFRKLAAN
jgi:hypothetical protein